MHEVKEEFLEGCKANNINEDTATRIFNMIEKSSRYSFNKSITPDCTVQTSDNKEKTIDELSVGEFVKTPYGFSKVLNKYENGDKEVFEVELESGHKIKCSMEHEFLCSDNKKRRLKEILSLSNIEIVHE